MKIAISAAALSVIFSFNGSIVLAQDAKFASSDGSVTLSSGLGIGYLSASEFVYDGSFKESQLDYRSKAIGIYSTTLKVDLPEEFSLRLNMDVGRGGSGSLTDYDWNDPFYVDTTKSGWSDRSISPDTDVGHYWSGSAELAHPIFSNGATQIEALGGVKYTDVKWDAYGGTYVYSEDAFRDTVGAFPSDEKGISYTQRIPAIYVGMNGHQTTGRLTVSGGLDGGLTFGIHDIDNHWLSDLLYHDNMNAAPMLMATAQADLSLTSGISLYLSGSFERVFRARGSTRTTDTDTGETETDRNVAGALFQSVLLKFGVKATF